VKTSYFLGVISSDFENEFVLFKNSRSSSESKVSIEVLEEKFAYLAE